MRAWGGKRHVIYAMTEGADAELYAEIEARAEAMIQHLPDYRRAWIARHRTGLTRASLAATRSQVNIRRSCDCKLDPHAVAEDEQPPR